MFDYYDLNPEFEKWVNRLVGLIFVLAGIFGIVVAFHGSFQKPSKYIENDVRIRTSFSIAKATL